MNGQSFFEKDLVAKATDAVVGGGENGEDLLTKINSILGNIDGLLTHIIDIKEKHPEILAKVNSLRGGQKMTGFKDLLQPPKGDNPDAPAARVSPDKLYTLLIGLLHQLEGNNLTIEQAKQLCIQNKEAIKAKIKQAIPTIME